MIPIDMLREVAEQINNKPQDHPQTDWGTASLSSNYIMNHMADSLLPHKKLFRQKKLSFEPGLVLHIYSYPSYQLFELMRTDPLLKECRGIILSPSGVRSRPFPVIPTIDWDVAIERMETEEATIKINGLMLIGISVQGSPICIGKGGKEVEVPTTHATQVRDLTRDAILLGLTPIFELVHDKPFVLREKEGCHLVGLRSIKTGRMAVATDLIKLASLYGIDGLTIIDREMMKTLEHKIEGVVFNDGETIVRAKTPFFKKLQRITSILRYGRRGDLAELVPDVDRELLQYNLTTIERDNLKRRQLL